MKAFLLNHKKQHLWLAANLLVVAAWFLFRGQKRWMTALAEEITGPLRQTAGRLCYLTEVSVMEILCVLLSVGAAAYVIWAAVAVVRAKGHRGSRAYRAVLGAVNAALTLYAGFCLLWGVNYWAETFQDKSAVYAEPVAYEDLVAVTAYFAGQLSLAADDVARDGNGVFAVPREEILAASPEIYGAAEKLFPFLEFDDPGVKAMAFSRWFSAMEFTGFYCPFTGESNVNVDSPACLLPATVAHELAHQRGIASEQECNFLAVLASVTSGNDAYEYAGWLKGYINLSNALYSVDRDAYWEIRDTLPETVEADLADNSAYWKRFSGTAVQKVSNTVYDGILKAYGDERGVRSYGAVVDLLVVYYRDAARTPG